MRKGLALLVPVLVALAVAPHAWAHASITAPVVKAKTLQQFTLDVQAEKENATTTRVEVDFPEGFEVETFPASPGWKRSAVTEGGGEEAPVRRVVWSGREQSRRADPVFHFTGTLAAAKTYAVEVRQVYSDGEVVDWDGPEGSERPAAFVEGVSSFGDNSGSTLAIVALIVAGIGAMLGIVALATRGRPLA